MAIQKTEAIVLKKFDFRDSSLIVTLFTRDFGKLKTVVKGVRKEGSGELVNFEVLNHLSIVFYEKAGTELHLLSESVIEDPMLSIRDNFKTFSFGCFLAEVADAFYDVHEISVKIFDALLESLKNMTPDTLGYKALRFELAVLRERGLYPGISACVRCRKNTETRWMWSPRQGGILCGACAIKDARVQEISPELIAVLKAFHSGNPEGHDGKNNLWVKAEKMIREFIRMRAEHAMRTGEFLDSLDQFCARQTQLKAAEPL